MRAYNRYFGDKIMTFAAVPTKNGDENIKFLSNFGFVERAEFFAPFAEKNRLIFCKFGVKFAKFAKFIMHKFDKIWQNLKNLLTFALIYPKHIFLNLALEFRF